MDETQRAHQRLTIAADPPGPPVLAPGPELVRRARRRRRVRRHAAVAAVAVLATGGFVTPVALLNGRSHPAPVAAPSAPPPPEFGVAAPLLQGVLGPIGMQQPLCRTGAVHGTAQLLPSAAGVLGVIRLRGDKCSLRTVPATIALLDQAGRALDVPIRDEANANPGGLIRPDLAEAAGDVVVGFAWRGSWCGVPATRLRLAAVADRGARADVTVPVTGRSPACSNGQGSSGYVAPGLVGRPGDPVQPAPPAWTALHATVELPAAAREDESIDFAVLLQNTGDRPVELSPCANYWMLVSGAVLASNQGAAGLLESGNQGKVPCGRALPPGGSLRLPLVLDVGSGPYAPGVVHVEWAMAGVPTARGELPIR